MTYKKNLNIPGWNQEEILNVIGKFSAEVPENGKILEMGALFGRTTYTIGHSKHPSVSLTTIDCWPNLVFHTWPDHRYYDRHSGEHELNLIKSHISGIPSTLSTGDFYKLWAHFTEGIPNLTGIHTHTSVANNDYPMYDLIIHDAAHDYDGVYADLVHWFPKLKPGCPMIIDDYDIEWDGLMRAVDRFVAENNIETEKVTHRNILLKGK